MDSSSNFPPCTNTSATLLEIFQHVAPSLAMKRNDKTNTIRSLLQHGLGDFRRSVNVVAKLKDNCVAAELPNGATQGINPAVFMHKGASDVSIDWSKIEFAYLIDGNTRLSTFRCAIIRHADLISPRNFETWEANTNAVAAWVDAEEDTTIQAGADDANYPSDNSLTSISPCVVKCNRQEFFEDVESTMKNVIAALVAEKLAEKAAEKVAEKVAEESTALQLAFLPQASEIVPLTLHWVNSKFEAFKVSITC